MGAPLLCTWNQFTIRERNESLDWLESDIGLIEEQYQQGRLTDEAILAYEIIKRPIDRDDSWYKKLWNINLPDVVDGHALLILKDDKFSLETYSTNLMQLNTAICRHIGSHLGTTKYSLN